MKKLSTLTLAIALTASSLAVAQSADDHAAHHAPVVQASAATYSSTGMVKKIDAVKGTVTFAHEPIQVLGWPAMTMNFSVKDKTLFKKLNVGKQVAFEFQQQGTDNVVTSVK